MFAQTALAAWLEVQTVEHGRRIEKKKGMAGKIGGGSKAAARAWRRRKWAGEQAGAIC
jgi:hypothetical protein